jgi:5-bromo-4-chloroindolyl phosphate hydrolysis protein
MSLNTNIQDIRKLKSVLFSLRLKYDNIKDESIKADVKSIIQIGDKVYAELIKNNDKTFSANRFICSYLPTIDSIIGKYNDLIQNGIKSEESLSLQTKITETLPEIKKALNKYYNTMFTSEILDVDVDLEALLKLI